MAATQFREISDFADRLSIGFDKATVRSYVVTLSNAVPVCPTLIGLELAAALIQPNERRAIQTVRSAEFVQIVNCRAFARGSKNPSQIGAPARPDERARERILNPMLRATQWVLSSDDCSAAKSREGLTRSNTLNSKSDSRYLFQARYRYLLWCFPRQVAPMLRMSQKEIHSTAHIKLSVCLAGYAIDAGPAWNLRSVFPQVRSGFVL